jgi:HEPN domain-containing protein
MNGPTHLDPHRWEEVVRWLFHANDDLGVVDAILMQSSPSLFGAALHCQQAAEEMAKAVLIAFGVRPPRIHDVDRLGDLVGAVHFEIGAEIQKLSQLTTWYAAARYPDVAADSLPSLVDIRAALVKLRVLHQRIQSLAPQS